MLDLADIPKYLMDRNLLGPEAIVDGQLQVVDASRLNRVFVVTAAHQPGFVVKLAGESGTSGVAHEAAVLERLRAIDRDGRLSSHLPTPVSYDVASGALVLEAAPRAQDMARRHARGRFSRSLAREAGRGLALLHTVPPVALEDLGGPDHAQRVRLHRLDLDALHTLSPAAVELTRILQGLEDVCTSLDELAASFRRESVIHGDVRWDNYLVWRSGDSKRWRRLQLIDWELCGAGDPAVDIGAFFGEYLRAWLQSIPIVDPEDPGRLLRDARFPLRRMRPALRAFWDAYTRHRTSGAGELSRTLYRATLFAGSSVLTVALEQAQTLAELRPGVLGLVRLSENILRRPEEATAHLLGFGPSQASA
jgi:aminoglycoside phosphotransferase (APT) family kinase protein